MSLYQYLSTRCKWWAITHSLCAKKTAHYKCLHISHNIGELKKWFLHNFSLEACVRLSFFVFSTMLQANTTTSYFCTHNEWQWRHLELDIHGFALLPNELISFMFSDTMFPSNVWTTNFLHKQKLLDSEKVCRTSTSKR